jgi:hypothetical protein
MTSLLQRADSWLETQKAYRAERPSHQKLMDSELTAWYNLLKEPSLESDVIADHARTLGIPMIKPVEETRIFIFWTTFFDAISKVGDGDQNDKLVEFIIQLQRIPEGLGPLHPEPWFAELPLFNNYWTEFVMGSCKPLSFYFESKSNVISLQSPTLMKQAQSARTSVRLTSIRKLFSPRSRREPTA